MTDGTLPVLARLRAEGACEDVATLPGFGDGANWPSLMTGVNPAKHGRYFRRQFRPRSYRRRLFDVDDDLARKPFWSALSEAGRRVAVLDVPYCPLDRSINGLLLVDWLIHDRYGGTRSFPPEFASDVLRRLGDDPVGGDSDRVGMQRADLKRLCDQLEARVRMKQELVVTTQREGPWDLLATAFVEPHDLGHRAWHLFDHSHPSHDPEWMTLHGNPFRSQYAAIDHAIGRILDAAPDDAAVLVYAGLGMGPDYTATNVMERILASLDGRQTLRYWARARPFGAPLPRPLKTICGKLDTAREIAAFARSRFFAMGHNENSGAIRINLKGREPWGQVERKDYGAVCDELTERFMEIRNVQTNRPIVDSVVRIADELDGEHLDSMPDLLVVWSREAPFSSIASPSIGRIDGVRSWGRTGDHTGHAMLWIHGNGLPRTLARRPHVVDVASTICALQGVALPDVEGSSLVPHVAAGAN